jgi:CheY-like chemotaxis protein
MKNLNIRILVISLSTADAEQICDLLSDDFDHVFSSTDEARFVADFDANEPDVVVLAFKQLEYAERCYLGLYRHSPKAHQRPHRTIVLCDKDNVRRAFELCSREYFDDYVMYWPMVFDRSRLTMSIIVAGRSLDATRSALPAHALAAHAQQVATLEKTLDDSIELGAAHMVALGNTVDAARESLDAAAASSRHDEDLPTTFDLDIGEPPAGSSAATPGPAPFASMVHALGEARVKVTDAQQKLVPMTEWINGLRKEVEPQMEAARQIGALAGKVLPDVLIVDDDAFQCKLLAKMLESLPCRLHFAHSGSGAMAFLARLKPVLILMDVELPDLNGVEITRRLKAAPELSGIPIVMITGHSERTILESSLRAGAIDFVVKPFDRETLLKKVARYLPVRN